jgi:hypothetical protein
MCTRIQAPFTQSGHTASEDDLFIPSVPRAEVPRQTRNLLGEGDGYEGPSAFFGIGPVSPNGKTATPMA